MVKQDSQVPNSYRETSRPHLQDTREREHRYIIGTRETEWRDIDAPQGTTPRRPSFLECTERERQTSVRGTGRTLLLIVETTRWVRLRNKKWGLLSVILLTKTSVPSYFIVDGDELKRDEIAHGMTSRHPIQTSGISVLCCIVRFSMIWNTWREYFESCAFGNFAKLFLAGF